MARGSMKRAVLGADAAAGLARAEAPGEALDDAAGLGDLLRSALGEILAAQDFAGAEEHDVVGGGFELFFLNGGVVLAFADVEDVLLVLGAFGRVALLRLLLAGVGERRFAGGVLGGEGVERSGFRAHQLAPEAGELEVEDGDLLGAGDDAGAGGVVDVVVAEDVDGGHRVDQRENLPGADRETGRAQAAAEGQQVAPDDFRGDRRQRRPRAVRGCSVITAPIRVAAGRGRRGWPRRRRGRCRRLPGT